MKRRVRLLREKTCVIDGIPAEIRYKNIKNLYLRVCPPDGHIELSVPSRTPQREAEDFVRRRRAWIDERRRLLFARAEKAEPQYAEGERVLLWGQEHAIKCRPLLRGRAYAERTADGIVLYVPADADADEINVHNNQQLATYLRANLRANEVFLSLGAGDIYLVHQQL